MNRNILIGMRIREARDDANMTLKDVGDLIGVSDSTIMRYEKGDIEKIKMPIINSIANALNVNPSWLVLKSDEKFVSLKDDTHSLQWQTKLITAYESASIPVRESACRVLNIDYVNPEKQSVVIKMLPLRESSGKIHKIDSNTLLWAAKSGKGAIDKKTKGKLIKIIDDDNE